MNLMRGTLVRGHVLIRETEEYVNLAGIMGTIRRCWRVKLALEESLGLILKAAEGGRDSD